MNITKRILIAAALFIGYSTQASELTPVLTEKTPFSSDLVRLVEEYVWDGTVTLNSEYTIGRIGFTYFGLSKNQETQWKNTLRYIGHCYPSTKISASFDYADHAAITYTFTNPTIQKKLVPIILYELIKNKKANAPLIVMDNNGKTYDFLLKEDKEANMNQLNSMGSAWPQGKEIIQTLRKNGFTGEHAQMARLLEWDHRHICSLDAYGPLATAFDHSSIRNRTRLLIYVATGTWEKAESTT